MNEKLLVRVLCLSASALLAACGGASKGEVTVKGTRIAVIEQAKVLEADKSLEDIKPVLARPIINVSWAQAGYDSQHSLPHVQANPRPDVLWSSSLGDGSSSDYKLLASPVVSRGVVYTMDARGLVRAFDAPTGDRKWEVDTTPKDSDDPAIGGGLAVDGNLVFATTGFGDVLAIQTDTGEIKWRKALMNPLRAAPTVMDNRVYVVSIDNTMNVLNALTGESLWHQGGIAESATLMGAAGPAVQGDTVVVPHNSGEIYGLRAQNGRTAWNYSLASSSQVGALPAIADIRGLPVIEDGRIYAVGHSGRMVAIDQRSGERVWEADIGGINTPVVSENAIFVYTNDSQLVALTRDTGRVLWVSPLPKRVDPTDRDSDPLLWAGPVVAGERLWMVNSEGYLTSFSPQDGAVADRIEIGEPLYVSPIVVDRTYYLVTDKGSLIALR